MTEPNTHLDISTRLCGEPIHLDDGTATVSLKTVDEMGADAHGLVHGGFVFGAADYAAMLAVNDPNVVLGSAETRFIAPVRVGDVVDAKAIVSAEKGKKRTVDVQASVGDVLVFEGTFTTFVLENHVLDSEDSNE